jgi:hypothetical protein
MGRHVPRLSIPTKLLDMNCYCSFCSSAGVAGPHDHFLRASKALGAAVTCPKLLSTECAHCGRKGHTARYCGEARDKMNLKRVEAIKVSNAAMNRGEWTSTGKVRNQKAAPKLGGWGDEINLAGRFGALDIETDDEPIAQVPSGGLTWAQVAHKATMDEESDDELPPLIWGKINTVRWSDQA